MRDSQLAVMEINKGDIAMNLTHKERQAGCFELTIIHDELKDHELNPGDVAIFRPAVEAMQAGRVYAIPFNTPIPELKGYLVRVATKQGGRLFLQSAISTFRADAAGASMAGWGELLRVIRPTDADFDLCEPLKAA